MNRVHSRTSLLLAHSLSIAIGQLSLTPTLEAALANAFWARVASRWPKHCQIRQVVGITEVTLSQPSGLFSPTFGQQREERPQVAAKGHQCGTVQGADLDQRFPTA